MVEARIDEKGRIQLPKDIRESTKLRVGDRVRLTVQGKRVIVSAPVSPREFSKKMRGFIRGGSRVRKFDPMKLKKIWEAP